jgi:hypothetical protein
MSKWAKQLRVQGYFPYCQGEPLHEEQSGEYQTERAQYRQFGAFLHNCIGNRQRSENCKLPPGRHGCGIFYSWADDNPNENEIIILKCVMEMDAR